MATRPVTWELDVPPASLFTPIKTPLVQEVPSLGKLRASLTGTRFEFLKASVFAAFLVALMALALHGSRLANSDNQFGANAAAAARGFAAGIYQQAASLRRSAAALVGVAMHRVSASITPAPSAAVVATLSKAAVTVAPPAKVSHLRHKAHHAKSAPHLAASPQPGTDAPSRLQASLFQGLVSVDTLIAAMAALLLYTIFVLVFVRINGGMRTLRGNHAV